MTKNQIDYINNENRKRIDTEANAIKKRADETQRRGQTLDYNLRKEALRTTERGQNMQLGGTVVQSIPKYLQALKPSLLDLGGGE